MNEADFTTLCRELMPGMYRIGMSMLRRHQDAQDAVQQCLMKAWAARERVQPGKERAWLMRILVNECRTVLRQRRRMLPVAEVPEAAYTPPDTALRDAIDALPDAWRLPVLLKYMEGMSEVEAAQALGVSRPVLKGRLYRARRALEKALKEEVELE